MTSTLDGITVLDLSNGPAGALTTMFLCDHGARVVRVIDVDDTAPRRGGYLVWDRGKTCVRLDFSQLASPLHPDALGANAKSLVSGAATGPYERLLRGADVLVEDIPPASGRQAMVHHEWLAALNPRLIHCSITAYGKHGPLKDEPPIDDLVMARMGILGSQPGFRPGPVHVVHPLPSTGAALLAAQGMPPARTFWGDRLFPMAAPIGGTTMIIGWLVLSGAGIWEVFAQRG